MPFQGRGRDDGQTTEGLVLKSSPKKEQVDVSSETKGESTSSINLSLEEFPLLPGSKKAVPPRSPQPGWPAEESSSAQKSQPVPVEFGFFGLPLSPLIESSQREGKELHFSFSTTMDSDLAEPSEDKKKEMYGTSDKWKIYLDLENFPIDTNLFSLCRIVEQPYKLEDDKDFPALSG